MTIKEIIHNPERGIKYATVTLNYDELRDLSNVLCDIEKDENWIKRPSYWKVRRNIHWLFDLVKNGCVDDWSVYTSYDFVQREEAAKAKQDRGE